MNSIRLVCASLLILSCSSCAVLFGNVKPVTERSEHYEVKKLDIENSPWKKLVGEGDSNAEEDPDHSDIAYQSENTSSIISINSACRSRIANHSKDLKDFTNLLLLGVTDISNREERTYTLSNALALETTLEGNMNRQKTKIQAIVLRKESCIYDLMYISRPHTFNQEIKDFQNFVSSLKLN